MYQTHSRAGDWSALERTPSVGPLELEPNLGERSMKSALACVRFRLLGPRMPCRSGPTRIALDADHLRARKNDNPNVIWRMFGCSVRRPDGDAATCDGIVTLQRIHFRLSCLHQFGIRQHVVEVDF